MDGCLAFSLAESEVPIGSWQLRILILIRERVKELEIGFRSDGLELLKDPTLLPFRADHRIKSAAALSKLHHLGPRRKRFRCPPLVEKFRFCVSVPDQIARGV